MWVTLLCRWVPCVQANTKLSGHVRQLSQAAASARSLADAADLLHELRTVVSTREFWQSLGSHVP